MGANLIGNPNSLKRLSSHIVFDAAFASARYSASMVDRANALCVFEPHEIRFRPKKLVYVDVDVRLSIFLVQSTSE